MINYILTDEAKKLQQADICDPTPIRGTKYSSGIDLKACIREMVKLWPGQILKIPTGIKINLTSLPIEDENGIMALCGLLLPRSSSNGLVLTNTIGLIDADYQGEIFAKVTNISEEPINIYPGDRIVQLMIIPSIIFDFIQVDKFSSSSERGENGFGSTGVK